MRGVPRRPARAGGGAALAQGALLLPATARLPRRRGPHPDAQARGPRHRPRLHPDHGRRAGRLRQLHRVPDAGQLQAADQRHRVHGARAQRGAAVAGDGAADVRRAPAGHAALRVAQRAGAPAARGEGASGSP